MWNDRGETLPKCGWNVAQTNDADGMWVYDLWVDGDYKQTGPKREGTWRGIRIQVWGIDAVGYMVWVPVEE